MPLDRRAVERRDFPLVRRGFDPEAVRAHLAGLADELETLERRAAAAEQAAATSAGRSDVTPAAGTGGAAAPLAREASEQVRAILEAAEGSAAGIERAAWEDADRIRAEATEEARALHAQVAERLRGLLGRVAAMEDAVGGLEAALPSRGAASSGPAAAPGPPPAPTPGGPPAGGGAAEEEGARLVALSMALNGQGREETDRYVREHFDLDDPERLLDEVWASMGTSPGPASP